MVHVPCSIYPRPLTGTLLAETSTYSQEGSRMKRVLLTVILMLGASAVGSAQTALFYFPQIAAGDSWRTTIFISNPRSDRAAAGSITFTRSDGGPFGANWVDEMGNNVSGGSNVIQFQLAPGQ